MYYYCINLKKRINRESRFELWSSRIQTGSPVYTFDSLWSWQFTAPSFIVPRCSNIAASLQWQSKLNTLRSLVLLTFKSLIWAAVLYFYLTAETRLKTIKLEEHTLCNRQMPVVCPMHTPQQLIGIESLLLLKNLAFSLYDFLPVAQCVTFKGTHWHIIQ